MKRKEIEALLQGLENPKEIIDKIMAMNGTDIELTKREFENDAKELASYREGGEKYVDPKELERLRQSKETFDNRILSMAIASHKPISEKALMAELDRSKIKVKDDYTVEGLDEQITALKGNDKLKALFVAEQPTIPPGTGSKQQSSEFGKTETITLPKFF